MNNYSHCYPVITGSVFFLVECCVYRVGATFKKCQCRIDVGELYFVYYYLLTTTSGLQFSVDKFICKRLCIN